MRIRLAFAVTKGDAASEAWLQAAVDEYTEDEHNGIPEFYEKALAEVSDSCDIREVFVNVPQGKIEGLFDIPTIDVTVVKG